MYRHFAAITVIVTATMAFVTDSKKRDAANDRLDSLEQRIKDERLADQQEYGSKILVTSAAQRGNAAAGWSGGDDMAAGYASGGGNGGGEGRSGFDSSYVPTNVMAEADFDPDNLVSYGASEEQLEQLTEEEKRRLLEQARKGRFGDTAEQRQQQISSLTAQSATRAASAGD